MFYNEELYAFEGKAWNDQDDMAEQRALQLRDETDSISTLPRLYNCTSHRQSGKQFAALGWNVELDSRVQHVPPDQLEAEGMRAIRGIPAGAHVLVGGAQIIMDVAVAALLAQGCRLYAAQIEHQGNRVNILGVTETPQSRRQHEEAARRGARPSQG
jgi:hypothetical protein